MTIYYETLKNVCENALLNLYIEVANRERFIPKPARTKIIKQYLKPKLKNNEFKIVKKELKRLTLVADTLNLESELFKLIANMNKYRGKGDAESVLFDFLANLHVWTGLMVQLSTKGTVAEPGNIYLLEDEVFVKLDSNGHYLNPIELYVYTLHANDIDELLAKAAKDHRFIVTVGERHDNQARLEVMPRAVEN